MKRSKPLSLGCLPPMCFEKEVRREDKELREN
jgi:hypothetical protein